jgi:hypothetical protein
MAIENKLPVWDVKLGQQFEKLGPLVDVLLIILALSIIYVVIHWHDRHALKALYLAFLVSP